MRVGAFNLSKGDVQMIVLGLGAFILFRQFFADASRGIAQGAAEAVGGVVVGAATGAVVGVAKSVGIPETDAQRCEAAIAAGNYWDASFYCPAGTFLQSAWGALFDPATGEQVGTVAPPTGKPEIVTVEPAPDALPGIDPGTDANISDWIMP